MLYWILFASQFCVDDIADEGLSEEIVGAASTSQTVARVVEMGLCVCCVNKQFFMTGIVNKLPFHIDIEIHNITRRKMYA